MEAHNKDKKHNILSRERFYDETLLCSSFFCVWPTGKIWHVKTYGVVRIVARFLSQTRENKNFFFFSSVQKYFERWCVFVGGIYNNIFSYIYISIYILYTYEQKICIFIYIINIYINTHIHTHTHKKKSIYNKISFFVLSFAQRKSEKIKCKLLKTDIFSGCFWGWEMCREILSLKRLRGFWESVFPFWKHKGLNLRLF